MSGKNQNTLFITFNLIIILTCNILLLSCDDIKKSTISKNNMLIEVTSEPQFFSTVKETLDQFDNGIFVSYDYIDPEDSDSYNKSSNKQEDNYYEEKESDNEDYDSESIYDEEQIVDEEYSEEMDLELIQLEKELEDYDIHSKSEEELKAKLNQMTALINKVKKGLNEDVELVNNEAYESSELLNSEEDEFEYIDEENQNAVLRQFALNNLKETDPEVIGDCEKRNIKKLSLWTMFNMETEVKFSLNSIL